MRFLFIEPFYGGSHRILPRGWWLIRATISNWRRSRPVLEMAHARCRASFCRAIDDLAAYDGIITSGLMSLADFTALTALAARRCWFIFTRIN
jgi:hypothetical protein